MKKKLLGIASALAVLVSLTPTTASAWGYSHHHQRQQTTVFTLDKTLKLPDDGGSLQIIIGRYTCQDDHQLILEGRQAFAANKPRKTLNLQSAKSWHRTAQKVSAHDDYFDLQFDRVPNAQDGAFDVTVELRAGGELADSTVIRVPGCEEPAAGVCPATTESAVVAIGDTAYGTYMGASTLAVYKLPHDAQAQDPWVQRIPQKLLHYMQVNDGCSQVELPSSGKIQLDLLKGKVTPPDPLTDHDMGPMVRSIAFINRNRVDCER